MLNFIRKIDKILEVIFSKKNDSPAPLAEPKAKIIYRKPNLDEIEWMREDKADRSRSIGLNFINSMADPTRVSAEDQSILKG